MLGTNSNGDTSTATTDGAESPEASSPQQAPMPSGLSALIRAATSQLGHLADVALNEASVQAPSLTTTPTTVANSAPFPETLMALCLDPSNTDTITFLPDGKFFAVRRSTFDQIKGSLPFDSNNSDCTTTTTFADFVELCEKWGFSRIGTDEIVVLRHPKFVQGDYDRCAHIQYGESPQDVRRQALPARNFATTTTGTGPSTQQHQVDDPCNSKRRLSPGFLARRDSVSSVSSSRQKTDEVGNNENGIPCVPSLTVDEDCVRSVALVITTEKLKIQNGEQQQQQQQQSSEGTTATAGLVDTAVTSATHDIVTGAIESLLRDESHSTKTFLKHEKELSRSSIPGVVPVCKQLFSPTYKEVLLVEPAAANKQMVSKELAAPAQNNTRPPRIVTTGSVEDDIKLNGARPTEEAEQEQQQPLPSEISVPALDDNVVLQESSNGKPLVPTEGQPSVKSCSSTGAAGTSDPAVTM